MWDVAILTEHAILVGTSFGCRTLTFTVEIISILGDIRGLVLFTKTSDSRYQKSFVLAYPQLNRTVNRK